MNQGAVSAGLSRLQGGTRDPGRSGLVRSALVEGRAAHLAVGLVALAGLVVGCAPTEPDVTPAPTVEEPGPTPTPTPSETPAAITPPEPPAEMERADEVGAAAAATYFMELFSYVLRTGDIEDWDRISGQTCQFCASTRADSVAIYAAGGSITGGAATLGTPEVLAFDESLGGYAVSVPYTFAVGEERDASGVVVRSIDEEFGSAVLDVLPSERGWLLLEGSGGTEEAGE